MDIKQKYSRFRQWQQEPFNYSLRSEEKRQCANCHQDYTGNFCPYCSQKAGLGKVTWASIAKGITVVWGMDSRSLLYSLWQLLLRPGYLIRDYINGERQVSFPPVKMLMLVAIVFGLIIHFTGIRKTPPDPHGDFEFMQRFFDWFNKNPGWGQIVKGVFLILPTWLFFRHSPRQTRHTIPEGFYIQVFMATLALISLLICALVIPTDRDTPYLILLVYYIIAYRQLFGYGWWGTIWRTMLMGLEGLFLMLYISLVLETLYGKPVFEQNSNEAITLYVGIFIINAAIVAICYYISRYTSKRAQSFSELSQPEPQDNELREDESLEEMSLSDEPQLDDFQYEMLLEEEPLEDLVLDTSLTDNPFLEETLSIDETLLDSLQDEISLEEEQPENEAADEEPQQSEPNN